MLKYRNPIVVLLVLLIIVAGAAVWFKKYNNSTNTREKIEVTKVDLEKAEGKDKVPVDFPKEIPLQLTDVEDSFTMSYPERNVVVTGVTFKTFRSANDIYETYNGFMQTSGYTVDVKNTDRDRGVLYGAKDGNVLGMIISSEEAGSMRRVQVVYTQYKR